MRALTMVDHTRTYAPGPGVLDAIAEALTVQIERDFARYGEEVVFGGG